MPFKKGLVPWNKGNKTPKDINRYRRTYLAKNPWVKNWTASIIRAKKKGWRHELSVSGFKELWFRDDAVKLKAPSIDRIDPSKGYIHGNCRFIERSENSRLGVKGIKKSLEHRAKIIKNLHWYKKQNGKSN